MDALPIEMVALGPEADVVAEDQLQALTKNDLQKLIDNHKPEKQVFDVSATSQQVLGRFTVLCLIMNRTIASGIFTQPINILYYAGSSGVAITLWVFGGIIIWAVVVCWLELAMTIPLHEVFHGDTWVQVSAPKNGGDKNYLEYIYRRPRYLATCVFGIVFIVFGNLAGNALQFGVFVQESISPTCKEEDNCFNKAAVLGWAVFALSVSALINVLTRHLAIILNNVFAVCKMGLLIAVAFMGIIYGTQNGNTCRKITWQNQGDGGSFGDIVLALFFSMYPYTGFEQPFYVLAEVDEPKRKFPSATNISMLILIIIYPLVNVSFLCVVPYEDNASLPVNIATAFFEKISGNENRTGSTAAVQAVTAMLAVFIFGNIIAQTYTASRVKQEIAKEGILPWSLLFAANNNTILARLWSSTRAKEDAITNLEGHLEQTPIASTFLHWVFEVVLVLAFGIPLPPSSAYRILTFLYTFTIVGILGLLTIGGLLYLKVDSWLWKSTGRKWHEVVKWKPWLDPLPAIFGTLALAFLLVAVFVPPTPKGENNLAYWISPTVGWAITLLGVVWWLGLQFLQWRGRRTLVTRRVPYIEIDLNGIAKEKAEFVEHEWIPNLGS